MRVVSRIASERGDTIVEVIFAVVIFALVAITSLSIMNQGIATGERSLEVTLVRLQMDAQAEGLRYIHEAMVADPTSDQAKVWTKLLTTYAEENASPYGVSNNTCALPGGSGYKPFVLNTKDTKQVDVWSSAPSIAPTDGVNYPPYSQVIYNADSSIKAAYGLWVEAVPSSSFADTHFVDFHIRACWPSPSGPVPATLGTIVRLYDPAR